MRKDAKLLLSLFCGAGGLDLGFEEAGFQIRLAFDKRPDSIASYNRNRPAAPNGLVQDIRELTLSKLDELNGGPFSPIGVVGGPPCQSFSRANNRASEDDPRHELPIVYAKLINALNDRNPLAFFVFENVTGLTSKKHIDKFNSLKAELSASFNLFEHTLNSKNYSVPQKRERLFLIGFNKKTHPYAAFDAPSHTTLSPDDITVQKAIGDLPEPVFYKKGLDPATFETHPNHWCMTPKSKRFFEGGLLNPGDSRKRSFKTLAWNAPSITVAYGHREVHVHPNCKRRLSVLEAMLLQGFPRSYILEGSLSSQITQVSEAVPPPVAKAVAQSIAAILVAETQKAMEPERRIA